MVNRNDDTVSAVLVAGQAVFLDGEPTEVLGTQRTGSFLRTNTPTAATARAKISKTGPRSTRMMAS